MDARVKEKSSGRTAVSAKPKTVDANILGRVYKVACADEERPALDAAVEYVDAKMSEIKDAGRVASVERIAVMAALNIAHELLSARNAPASEGGIHDAQDGTQVVFDIESVKRRMNSMQAMLDDVLVPQERLL